MHVSVESTSPIGRRLTVSIPAAEVRTEVEERMNEVLRHKRIDGFRPGKAPKNLIQQKFGAQIRHEAISKIIETSLPTILEQEALEPAGRPEIEQVSNVNEEGKDLSYVVSFEVFPEVNLPDYSSIQVEKYEVKLTEADVDTALKKLQHQLGTWHVVDRPAKKGDQLKIDYTSLLNGKPYENNSSQDIAVELGTHVFIDGFEEGLIGAVAGETRELDLHFPQDWRIEKLAGKPVHFTIIVKEVTEQILAPLDETFASKIGAEGTDSLAIRQKVRENLEKQIQHLVQEGVKKQALDVLLALNEILLPKALVEHEVSLMHQDLHRKMGDKAHDTCQHHGLEDEARRRVALSLILRKIVKLENLIPDEGRIKNRISEIARSFGNADFIESMYYESEELLSGIRNSVLVEQAIDLILVKASVVLKSISVEALFKQEGLRQ